MKKTKDIQMGLFAGVLLAGLGSNAAMAAAPTTAEGDLYFTRYGGAANNVSKIGFKYDGTVATLDPAGEKPIVQSPGADGIIFAPNGDLLIGGANFNKVYQYTTAGALVSSGDSKGQSYHLALDPGGKKVWTSDFGGDLAELPLTGGLVGNGTLHNVTGDDGGLTQIAFAPSGKVFYVDGSPNGGGNLGTIDLGTFVTDRFSTGVNAAHGLIYDSYTKLMTIFGRGHTGTFDPEAADPSLTLKQSAQITGDFDQGAVDGFGHALIAGNNQITFLDYSVSGDITNPNYTKIFNGFSFIDDVAPLSGLGSTPPPDTGVPDTSSWPVAMAELTGVAGLLAFARRRVSIVG